jgi:predicted methyltransferase
MTSFGPEWSRRAMLAAAFAGAGVSLGALAACDRKQGEATPAAPKTSGRIATLEDAAAGEWRSAADKARDAWRHPVESLRFWGLEPGMTVVEFWPGAGWYSDIIAPFLAATGGKLYAAQFQAGETSEPSAAEIVEAYRRKLAARPRVYGDVTITAFGPTSGPVAPAGTVDRVLFLRNIHNWMAAGVVDKAFRDAFAALKPGGVLGVEEHRADPGGVQDVLASSGYVEQAYVVELAKDAGFISEAASELNANPKDTKDHPFGVWTLPPTRLTAPRGQPARPGFDHTKYDAIGESDRMTLRFKKPL